MRFLVDAQLPKALSDFITQKGYDSLHTLELAAKNRTTDHDINKIALEQNRIVITKDNDFLESFILRSEPPKLLLIITGNIPNNQLLDLFNKNFTIIIEKITANKLVEISRTNIIIHE